MNGNETKTLNISNARVHIWKKRDPEHSQRSHPHTLVNRMRYTLMFMVLRARNMYSSKL